MDTDTVTAVTVDLVALKRIFEDDADSDLMQMVDPDYGAGERSESYNFSVLEDALEQFDNEHRRALVPGVTQPSLYGPGWKLGPGVDSIAVERVHHDGCCTGGRVLVYRSTPAGTTGQTAPPMVSFELDFRQIRDSDALGLDALIAAIQGTVHQANDVWRRHCAAIVAEAQEVLGRG